MCALIAFTLFISAIFTNNAVLFLTSGLYAIAACISYGKEK